MKKKVAAITTIAILSSTFATTTYASTYSVQKGDTLYHIAKKYNTSVSNIKTWNQLNSDLIHINQTLKVANDALDSKPPVKEPVQQPPATSATTYTIVKGDTLSKIAKQHNISLSNLMNWNNLDHHIIYPGQVLKVTNGSSTTQPTVPVVTVPVSKPETAPNVPASSLTTYVVQKGDTLSHISKKYGVSVKQLKENNNLSSDLIFIGQTLNIGEASNTTTTDGPKVVEPTPAPVPVPVPAQNENLISFAKSLLGVPYVWAGSSASGFDCSGFIYYAFKSVGNNVSRLSTDGYYSRSYYVDTPQVGDLVFFENTYRKGISHMGIYLGNNEFIHASSSKGVTISNLNQAYYKERFDGFKRFY